MYEGGLIRSTQRPDEQRCEQDLQDSYSPNYQDLQEGQWFCFKTSEGNLGYFEITDVTDRNDETTIELTYGLFSPAPPSPTPDQPATTDTIELASGQGVDFDADEPRPLPWEETAGIDVYNRAGLSSGLQTTVYEGGLIRSTQRPDEQRCEQDLQDSYSPNYQDLQEGQWFCFKTSEGNLGYFEITDVTDRNDETTIELTYGLFG